EGDDRVEPRPAGEDRDADAGEDPDRRPDVGHQMMRVRFEGDRTMLLAGPQQAPGDGEIDQGGERGNDDARPDQIQRLRVNEAGDRRQDDAGGGDQNQAAFDAAAEVFRLVVAVGMFFVRLLVGDAQNDQGDQGGDEIDDRFERVGEEADRPGHDVGGAFQRDRQHGGGDRQ